MSRFHKLWYPDRNTNLVTLKFNGQDVILDMTGLWYSTDIKRDIRYDIQIFSNICPTLVISKNLWGLSGVQSPDMAEKEIRHHKHAGPANK
jgi:hypothetical protein